MSVNLLFILIMAWPNTKMTKRRKEFNNYAIYFLYSSWNYFLLYSHFFHNFINHNVRLSWNRVVVFLVLLFSTSKNTILFYTAAQPQMKFIIYAKRNFLFFVFRISSKMRNFISLPVWTCSQKLNKMVYGFTSCYYFSFVRKLTCKILVNKFEKFSSFFNTISHNHKKFWW